MTTFPKHFHRGASVPLGAPAPPPDLDGGLAGFHLYEGLWRYVGMRDILAILKAVTLSSLVFVSSVLMFFGHGFPRSIFFLDWVLCLALVGGMRLTPPGVRSKVPAR
jgi:FlaA1/EpsC-like NDP-sugar epimerase